MTPKESTERAKRRKAARDALPPPQPVPPFAYTPTEWLETMLFALSAWHTRTRMPGCATPIAEIEAELARRQAIGE